MVICSTSLVHNAALSYIRQIFPIASFDYNIKCKQCISVHLLPIGTFVASTKVGVMLATPNAAVLYCPKFTSSVSGAVLAWVWTVILVYGYCALRSLCLCLLVIAWIGLHSRFFGLFASFFRKMHKEEYGRLTQQTMVLVLLVQN